jgi:hypothetical protein
MSQKDFKKQNQLLSQTIRAEAATVSRVNRNTAKMLDTISSIVQKTSQMNRQQTRNYKRCEKRLKQQSCIAEPQIGIPINVTHSVDTDLKPHIKELKDYVDGLGEKISKEAKSKFSDIMSHFDQISAPLSKLKDVALILTILGLVVYCVVTKSTKVRMLIGTILAGGALLGALKYKDQFVAFIRETLRFDQDEIQKMENLDLSDISDDDDLDEEVPAEAQISADDAYFIGGIILNLLAIDTMGKKISWKNVQQFSQNMGSWVSKKTDLMSIMTWVGEVAINAMNYIREHCFGMKPLDTMLTTEADVLRWSERVSKIIKLAFDNELKIDIPNADQVWNLYMTGLDHIRTQDKICPKFSPVKTTILKQLENLKPIMRQFESANVIGAGPRMAPLTLLFSGAAGVGKSEMLIPFTNALLARILPLNALEDFKSYWKDFIYCRQPEHEYWDGYRGQFASVIDDFGQAIDVMGQPDNEYMDIIRCSNMFPNTLHMADLGQKGNVVFRSKVLIANTNLNRLLPNSIHEPEALTRRFTIIKVFPRTDFSIDPNVQPHMRRLDVAKIPNGDVMNKNIYDFFICDKEFKPDTSQCFSYESLLEYTVKQYKRLEGRAGLYMDFLKRDLDTEIDKRQKTASTSKPPSVTSSAPLFEAQMDGHPVPLGIGVLPHGYANIGTNELRHNLQAAMRSTVVNTHRGNAIDEGFEDRDPVHNQPQLRAPNEFNPEVTVYEHGETELMRVQSFLNVIRKTEFAKVDPDVRLFANITSKVIIRPDDVDPDAELKERFLLRFNELNDDLLVRYNRRLAIHFPPDTMFRPPLWRLMFILSKYNPDLFELSRHMNTVDAYFDALEEFDIFSAMVKQYMYINTSVFVAHCKKDFVNQKILNACTTAHDELAQLYTHLRRFVKRGWMVLPGDFRSVIRQTAISLTVGIIGSFALFSLVAKIGQRVGSKAASKALVARQKAKAVPQFGQGSVDIDGHTVSYRMLSPVTIVDRRSGLESRVVLDPRLEPIIEKTHRIIRNKNDPSHPSESMLDDIAEQHRMCVQPIKPAEPQKYDEAGRAKQRRTAGKPKLGRLKQSTFQVEAQSAIDSNSYEMAQSVVKSNMYSIFLEDGSHSSYIGSLTFIRSRWAIFPEHFWYYFKERALLGDFNIILESVCSNRVLEFTVEQFLTKVISLNRHQHIDVSAVYLTDAPEHKNILDKFVYESDLSKEIYEIGLYVPTSFGMMASFSSCDLRGPLKVEENGTSWTLPRTLNYSIPTMKGDCGSLVFLNEPSLRGKIVGLHAAGIVGGVGGMATIVTRDDFDILEFNRIEPQGAHELPLIGDFEYIGRATPAGRALNTQIVASKLHSSWGPAKKAPARLKYYSVGNDLVDPQVTALMKYGRHLPDIPERLLTISCQYLAHLSHGKFRDMHKSPRVFSVEQATLGIPGVRYCESIPRSTSMGYPYVLRNPPDCKGKQALFGKGQDYDLTTPDYQLLKLKIKSDIAMLEQGIAPSYIFMDILKDELRLLAKVLAGSTRAVSAAPVDQTIVGRMYFMDFIRDQMLNRILNGSAVGINVHSIEWCWLYDRLTVHPNVIAFDISGKDGSVNKQSFYAINDHIVQPYYGQEDVLARRTLIKTMAESIHIFRDFLYKWNGKTPSGGWFTTTINTSDTLLMYIMAWILLHPDGELGLRDFENHVKVVAYGDDSVACVSDWAIVWYNQNTIPKVLETLGQKWTIENKTDGDVSDFRKISDITFLKRRFYNHPLIHRMVAPLDLETVLEIPYWTKKGFLRDTIERDNVEVALSELSYHPKEVFDEWAPKILSSARSKLNFVPSVVDQASLARELTNKDDYY